MIKRAEKKNLTKILMKTLKFKNRMNQNLKAKIN